MHSKHTVTAVTLAAVAALAVPTIADAHVTLQPKSAPAGSYVVENVRVPNETPDATTTKVVVQMPPGFASVSYQSVPGWTVTLKTSKLATPIKTDDGEVTEQVDQVTFQAAKGKGIAPGQFQDFALSVKLPDKPGKLTFKAVQTYSNGDVVRWIGSPDADEPAPQVELTAADTPTKTPAVAAPPTAAASSSAGDDGTDGLTIVALVLGALGLLVGLAGLLAARRRPASA